MKNAQVGVAELATGSPLFAFSLFAFSLFAFSPLAFSPLACLRPLISPPVGSSGRFRGPSSRRFSTWKSPPTTNCHPERSRTPPGGGELRCGGRRGEICGLWLAQERTLSVGETNSGNPSLRSGETSNHRYFSFTGAKRRGFSLRCAPSFAMPAQSLARRCGGGLPCGRRLRG